MRADLQRQLANAPRGALHPSHGDGDEQSRYLKRQGRTREQLMRQFINGDGPRGNTRAYLDGWERIFGGQHG